VFSLALPELPRQRWGCGPGCPCGCWSRQFLFAATRLSRRRDRSFRSS